MKVLLSICATVFFMAAALGAYATPPTTPLPTAQHRQINDLNGSWVVLMDDAIDGLITSKGSSCRLQLTNSGENFTGKYGDCMPSTIIDGIIYDEKLISAIQYTQKGDKNEKYCVYSGKIAPDGSIRGTYYTDGGESGDFQWQNATSYIGDVADVPVPGGKGGSATKPVYVAKSGTRPTATGYSNTTPPKAAESGGGQAGEISTEEVPAPTPDTQYHFVEEDDSMYRLASKYHLKLRKLLWLNHRTGVTDDKLQLGDRIRVSE